MLLLAIILAWIQRTTPDLRPGLTVYHPLQTPAPREPETEGEIIRSEHA